MIRLIEILAAGVTDDEGAVLAGGRVTFYDAGTTNLATVYRNFSNDPDERIPHANPATLDDAGRLIAYSLQRVKVVIQDSDGNTVRTIDHVGTSDSDTQAATSASSLAGDGLIANEDDALAVNVDGASLTIEGDEVKIADEGVQLAHLNEDVVDDESIMIGEQGLEIKPGGVTREMLASVGQQTSNSSGNFSSTNISSTDITNLSVSITTHGRPVILMLIPDGSSTGTILMSVAGSALFLLVRGATLVRSFGVTDNVGTLIGLDTPAAGTYTYKAAVAVASGTFKCENMKLVAFELA